MYYISLGILLISANPDEILSGSLDSTEEYADVSGIVISAIVDDNSGGDPVEGVKVRLLSEEGATTGKETFTDSNGRFSINNAIRNPSMLHISHPGNNTTRVYFVPGDNADLVVTLTSGDGEDVVDLRGESHLAESVYIATAITVFIDTV